jgi:hypothetical protein
MAAPKRSTTARFNGESAVADLWAGPGENMEAPFGRSENTRTSHEGARALWWRLTRASSVQIAFRPPVAHFE